MNITGGRGCVNFGYLVRHICPRAYTTRARMTGRMSEPRHRRAVIPFAFATLRLHRLEAACIPTNAGSIRLLENTGFLREGYAREYLCINGIWQDHLLYARLKGTAAP